VFYFSSFQGRGGEEKGKGKGGKGRGGKRERRGGATSRISP